MSPLSTQTYLRYKEFLEQRIAAHPKLMTEDSIRYSFFAALGTTGILQHEIILEYPHEKFKGKKIDTYVQASGTRASLYIEFKYHRVSDSTSPKPQKAGSLFKDFSRLSSIKSEHSRCLVIYLTDSEMARYFEKNDYSFWRKPTGDNFEYDDAFIESMTDTFKNASGSLHRARVSVEFSAELSESHHLRVFEVHEI